ncbi:MAG: hypothetical protein A2W91_11870 [Bacteroidetes bacterium GWF2_38_335]|nr:MAG: hypothetical protein A2W91_11870 [Bacteroidetes bacterium GWF2_38_335]OFY77975.1 MAG: hypothetical protein A2281_18615 [Bacteroidetes bacterium RIFOXYA12_FULL_38_20]HBS86718.1 hypothetical protein [Bacteroidales bacterium]
MKKFLLILFAASTFSFAANSQVTLTTAADFTATDVNGNTVNLFSLLDAGKHVVLEFWATW